MRTRLTTKSLDTDWYPKQNQKQKQRPRDHSHYASISYSCIDTNYTFE